MNKIKLKKLIKGKSNIKKKEKNNIYEYDSISS